MTVLQLYWLVIFCIYVSSVKVTSTSSLWHKERNCRTVWLNRRFEAQCPGGYGWCCLKSGLKDLPQFPASNSTNKLCMIDLGKNMLRKLKNSSFVTVTDVLWLWLYENDIDRIESDSFAGLSKLLWLDLSGNPIFYPNSFKPDVFKPLTQLKRINLKSRRRSQSYKGLEDHLQPLKNLEELYISGCYGCKFEKGFENLTNIRNLSLSGGNKGDKVFCNISVLQDSTFSHLPSIRRLWMSSCGLKGVEITALSPLKNLDFLDIAYNHQLTFAGLPNIFKGLKNSCIQVIDANHIHPPYESGTSLKKDNIEPIKELKTLNYLYLDLNKIEVIDRDVFWLLPDSLHTFTLAANRLSYGKYVHNLEHMKHVKLLDISRQNLHYDPFSSDHNDYVPNYDNLGGFLSRHNTDSMKIPSLAEPRYPSVSDTADSFLSNFYSSCSNKGVALPAISKGYHDTSFKCAVCLIKCAIEKTFCMCPPPNLKKLLWRQSFLDFKLKSFTVCKSPPLQDLDLSFNLFYDWIGPIYGLESLKSLNLAANFCSNLTTCFFDNMLNLKTLNLSHNFLGQSLHPCKKDADKTFKNLNQLEELDLSENRIIALSADIFQNLTQLKYLSLSKNMISRWNSTLQTKNLILLDLSDNKLESLPESLREFLDDSANKRASVNETDRINVDLRGNPIQCKCADRPFLRWISDSKVNIIFRSTDECHLQNGQVVPLVNPAVFPDIVSQLDVDCVPYSFIATSISIFIVSIISSIIIYRFRWKLRHIYYSRRRRHQHTGYGRLFEWDAFISYSDSEASFIKNKMIPAIEGDREHLKLWVADRDSQAGASVAENLTHAIYSSRKTLILLSKSYFKDNWCNYEMNMARVESVESKRKLFLIILFEDISAKEIPLDYLRLLRSEQSIEYPTHPQHLDTFWNSLAQAIQDE